MLEKSILDKESPVQTLPYMGGKALNLYMMNTQGVSVPAWCCISSELYLEFYQKIEQSVQNELQNIDLNSLDKIREVSAKIESLFQNLEFPKDLLDKINNKLGSAKYFAVRSSAVGEDGHESSFAGQLSTYLFVNQSELEKKIKLCWASAFSERVIQYNSINDRDYKHLKVAVIIQEMIDSEKSGVLFTVNPLMTKEYYNQAVITAGYGVGEGIVTDKVETDFYVYDRIKKNLVKSEYSQKLSRLVMGENGGLKEDKVPSSLKKASVLNHKNITQLVSTASSLFKFYGHEVDMEWAYDKQGKLYITQARPITTLNKAFAGRDILLDNSNVVESFPGLNTPWTLSVIRDVYKTVFTNAVLRIGVGKRRTNRKSYVFDHLIATHKGRVFYNLTNWYEMMRLVPYTEKYIKVWEEMLGVKSNPLSFKRTNIWQTLLFNPLRVAVIVHKILWMFIRLDSKLAKLDKKLQEDFDYIWRKDRKGIYLGYAPADFMVVMEKFKNRVFKDWDITLINDIYAFVCTAITKHFLKKLKISDVDNFFNDLLFGISGMDSVAPVKSIVAMAMLVKEDQDLKIKLQGLTAAGSAEVNILTSTENGLKFRKMFQHHINEFGDRGVEELKLESITFREDPTTLLNMVLDYSESPIESLNQGKSADRRKAATKELNKKLLTRPLMKLTLPFFLKMAIRSINYRENFRLHRSRGYGIVRKLTNYLGVKLASLGLIDDARDIYYLDYDELFRFTHALEFSNQLKGLVQTRKDLFEQYRIQEAAPRYKFNGKDYNPFIKDDDEVSGDLVGQPCSSGTVEAEVLVVNDINEVNKDASVGAGKILVAKMTDPGWVFLMTVSKGLIVEKGSILSHTAIIGRELGIPTIVGVKNATDVLKSGDKIKMDGQTGKITTLDE